MRGYLVRLIGYAALLGVAVRVAHELWLQRGLDAVEPLQRFHDTGVMALLLAPLVLALIGGGRGRNAALFIACSLAGAAITAPFACAGAAGV